MCMVGWMGGVWWGVHVWGGGRVWGGVSGWVLLVKCVCMVGWLQ